MNRLLACIPIIFGAVLLAQRFVPRFTEVAVAVLVTLAIAAAWIGVGLLRR